MVNQILIRYDEKDISANLYQNCFILCSKILQNVLHNLSWTVLLPWQHTGFQTSPILKAFLATFGVPFSYMYLQNGASYASSNKHINMLAWVCGLVRCFFELKITHILKSSGWGLEKNFYSHRPVFNGLHCKLAEIHVPLFIYLM